MLESQQVQEILVVDDGSTDATASIATELGLPVIATAGHRGPAAARNVGAGVARFDLLWFVDADVVVHADSAKLIRQAFGSDSVIPAAVFGSYDDEPAAANFLSQYKNLFHHFTHQRATLVANTFWSGCGAVRREAFQAVHGFDESINGVEDIALGYRLHDRGYEVHLLKELLSTHLKEWRLLNLSETDVFKRAIPWSRLIMSAKRDEHSLNLGWGERVRALMALCWWLSLFFVGQSGVPVFAVVSGLIVWFNLPMVRFFRCKRGVVFAIRALIFHQLYFLYSVLAYLYVAIETQFRNRRHG